MPVEGSGMDSTLMTLISTVAIAGAAALKVLWAR